MLKRKSLALRALDVRVQEHNASLRFLKRFSKKVESRVRGGDWEWAPPNPKNFLTAG
ncbi:MAG TPA: hypothetical protein VJI67_03480 [archaeon]|nr:hypothetical protein [archaeon]HLD81076.1 hypothetical protein [archaeon]